MAKTFRELEVWKRSIDLTVSIYRLTNDFPRQEIYSLTAQMRRAAVSISSNVAEGSARGTRRDFRQFVKQAEGSNCELQTQLIIARRLEFGDQTQLSAAETLSIEIGKMLGGLSAYLAREIQEQSLKPSNRNLQLKKSFDDH
ncbi:MAG TPA: four helix bundle protein [Edaphobacter sp.]|nr:four helix bundle protein [Edaphobacter sp.]